MISHDKKFIFVHVPRTGGTSLESFFCESQLKHIHFKQKHSRHEHELQDHIDYFSFSFVRNPWERMLSFYLFDIVGSTKYSLYNWLKLTRIRNRFAQSMSFFIMHNEKPRVNFVGRYENYHTDVKYICNKLNIEYAELPVLNKTNHNYYVDYYDEKTKKLVESMYKEDILNFEYEFGKNN